MEASILIFKFFLIIFIFFFFFNGNQNQKTILGKARIIDGDTIHIGNNKIRLHGIDAPEINQDCSYNNEDWKCGQLSKNFLLNLINLDVVNCQVKTVDKYKRYIAICFVNNLNINEMMVKNGWAIAYRYYSKDYVDEELIAKKIRLVFGKENLLNLICSEKKINNVLLVMRSILQNFNQ